MNRTKALTFEALRVMDEIENRGSFAAAADVLGRVPSALSYTMQKLEDELDIIIFDRSGHRTRLTPAGRLLLEQGRLLLDAADKLVNDVTTLSKGWEARINIVCEVLTPIERLFPLVTKLASKSDTQLSLNTEILAGAWERLEQDLADIVIAPQLYFRERPEIKSTKLYTEQVVYVATSNHSIHAESNPLSDSCQIKYRGIAIADTAHSRRPMSVQLLDRQPRLTVSTLENKRQAILAGIGVGTMPLHAVEQDLKTKRLKIIGDAPIRTVEMIMAWRRNSMGEAKSWLLREIPKLLK